jgi:hypothetical protein
MNIKLLILLAFINIEALSQQKPAAEKRDYDDYPQNWVDAHGYDTMTVKVLEFRGNMTVCGDRPTETLTIGYIARHDTVRLLVLCDLDTANWVGKYRIFVPDKRPPFPTGAAYRNSKYNATISKTLWGYFIDK